MECKESKELLSEYIDGLLDGDTRALVEEHLNACRGCRDELASLKTLVSELGALDTVPAPEDFLKQVHERLETPSRLSRILGTLFVPFRIKIPLEFAGAAVVALLLGFVFLAETPVKYRAPGTQDKQGERLAQKPLPAGQRIPYKEESLPSFASDAEETMGENKQKRALIELALLIKKFPEEEASKTLTLVDAPSLQTKDRKKSSPEKVGTAEGLSGRADSLDRAAKPSPEPASPAPSLEAQDLSAERDSAFPIDNVAEIVGLAGGEILEVHDAIDGSATWSILLDIPAYRYPDLLEKLGALGILQHPDSPPQDLTGDLQVRLRLLFPK